MLRPLSFLLEFGVLFFALSAVDVVFVGAHIDRAQEPMEEFIKFVRGCIKFDERGIRIYSVFGIGEEGFDGLLEHSSLHCEGVLEALGIDALIDTVGF